MNPCHAAALALAGWYLMMPPKASDGLPDTQASLTRWTVIESFDSAKECEQLFVSFSQKKQKNKADELQVKAATCIATDDPRLKEK